MENPVAQRIKDILTEKRWSVNALSKALDISQPTLSRQVSGYVAIDSKLILGLLLLFPDVSAEWLLRGAGNMTLEHETTDAELKAVCIEQAKEIFRLKNRIAELEGEKKGLA